MNDFIETIDTYGRYRVFNVNEIRDIVDYGSTRRIYFNNGSSIAVNADIEKLKSLIRRYRGRITKI